jgi:hypothetical protein
MFKISFLILLVLAFSNCGNLKTEIEMLDNFLVSEPNGWAPYNQCDRRWANESLWLNYVDSRKNYTLCNGNTFGVAFDAPLITMLASYLSTKNVTCVKGYKEVCNPKSLNLMILDYALNRFPTEKLWQNLGLGYYQNGIAISNVTQALKQGYVLFFQAPGDRNFYFTQSADNNYVYGFDAQGRNLQARRPGISFYGWFPANRTSTS